MNNKTVNSVLHTSYEETIAFTIGLLAVIGFGVFLVRRKVKKEYVSDEQLQRTLERALASANADSERCKNDEILDYNSLLKEFALNFETRDYEEAIAEDSFKRLEKGTLNFINETNFKRFLMILRSAGFIDSSLTRSQNALNFAYIVYLILREKKEYSGKIESYVRKWYVMSVISGRYSASPESKFDEDIRRIDELGFAQYFENAESAEMSEARLRIPVIVGGDSGSNVGSDSG